MLLSLDFVFVYVSVLLMSFPGARLAFFFFFFNDTATTEIYTLSLHDALPIFASSAAREADGGGQGSWARGAGWGVDRKSTRLNSSHSQISYAVFCLKKKKKHNRQKLV